MKIIKYIFHNFLLAIEREQQYISLSSSGQSSEIPRYFTADVKKKDKLKTKKFFYYILKIYFNYLKEYYYYESSATFLKLAKRKPKNETRCLRYEFTVDKKYKIFCLDIIFAIILIQMF